MKGKNDPNRIAEEEVGRGTVYLKKGKNDPSRISREKTR
jgi:hypothetical protein